MKKMDTVADGASKDILAENIETLRGLFPEAFTEGSDEAGPRWKVDFEALREILGDYTEEKPERYRFTWHGKSRARMISQTPSTGTLRPCPEESVDWDTTKNIFIEGDNLEVLKLLQKSYHKKVKMIYIDPPYNTGKQFIYPDKFQDNLETYLRHTGQLDDEGFKMAANAETSGRYHTNWLNMMYPRLKLAKNLLREDGVIFVSIDFRESTNLRHLMNEIFGEENMIFDVSVVNNLKGRNDREGIATCHEHVLIYCKPEYKPKGLSLSTEKIKEYSEKDENGKSFQWRDLRKRGGADSRKERPKMFFPIFVNPKNGQVSLSQTQEFCQEVLPKKSDESDGCWRWGWEKVEENIGIIRGKMVRGKKHWNVSYRVYLENDGEQRRSTPKSIWTGPKFSTDAATKVLSRYFPGIEANKFTPKSIGFLQTIIDQSTEKGDLILDFFAGTGSLGEAVFNQNQLDNAFRSFILIQLPENVPTNSLRNGLEIQTVSDLCKERLRKAINSQQNNNKIFPSKNFGFKVFKLDASNIIPWDPDFDTVEDAVFHSVENIKPDRTEADILYEILLKYGLDLAVPIEERDIHGKTVFIVGGGALVVCLDREITLETVQGIATLKDELNPGVMRVVFRDSGFQDDVVKTNTVQILKRAGIEDVKSL